MPKKRINYKTIIENNNRNIKMMTLIVLELFALVIIVYPTVVSAWYTTYSSDDFGLATYMKSYRLNFYSWVKGAFEYAINQYLTWQGTYASGFIQTLLSSNKGIEYSKLHVIMLFNVLFFILSLLYLIYSVCRYFYMKIEYIILLAAVCMTGIFGLYSWPEIFTWFTGATQYSIPLAFGLVGVGLLLDAEKSVIKTSIASCCMIVSSGGH